MRIFNRCGLEVKFRYTREFLSGKLNTCFYKLSKTMPLWFFFYKVCSLLSVNFSFIKSQNVARHGHCLTCLCSEERSLHQKAERPVQPSGGISEQQIWNAAKTKFRENHAGCSAHTPLPRGADLCFI